MFGGLSEVERHMLAAPGRLLLPALSKQKIKAIANDIHNVLFEWWESNGGKDSYPQPPELSGLLGTGMFGSSNSGAGGKENRTPRRPSDLEAAFHLWLSNYKPFVEVISRHGLESIFAVILCYEYKTAPVFALCRANDLLCSLVILGHANPALREVLSQRKQREEQLAANRAKSRAVRSQKKISREKNIWDYALGVLSRDPFQSIEDLADKAIQDGVNRLDDDDKSPLSRHGVKKALTGIRAAAKQRLVDTNGAKKSR